MSSERAAFIAQLIAELERPAASVRAPDGSAAVAHSRLSSDYPDARSLAARDVEALSAAMSRRLDTLAASREPGPRLDEGDRLSITRELISGVLVCLADGIGGGGAPAPPHEAGLLEPTGLAAVHAAVAGLACVLFVKAPAVLIRLPAPHALCAIGGSPDAAAAGSATDDALRIVGDLLEHASHGAVVGRLSAAAACEAACDVLLDLASAAHVAPLETSRLLVEADGASSEGIARLVSLWTRPLFLARDRLLLLSAGGAMAEGGSAPSDEETAALLAAMLAVARLSSAAARAVWHSLALVVGSARAGGGGGGGGGGAGASSDRGGGGGAGGRTVAQTKALWNAVRALLPDFAARVRDFCGGGGGGGGDERDIASICDLLRFLVSAPSIEARAVADAVDVVVSSGAASALCELASMPGVVSRRADNVAASCVASACLLFMAIRFPSVLMPIVSRCAALMARIRGARDDSLGTVGLVAWPLLLCAPDLEPTPLRSFTRRPAAAAAAAPEPLPVLTGEQTALFLLSRGRAEEVCTTASHALRAALTAVGISSSSAEACTALAAAVAACSAAMECVEFLGSAFRLFSGLQRIERLSAVLIPFADLSPELSARAGSLVDATGTVAAAAASEEATAAAAEDDDVLATGPAATRERAAASAAALQRLGSQMSTALRGVRKTQGGGSAKLD